MATTPPSPYPSDIQSIRSWLTGRQAGEIINWASQPHHSVGKPICAMHCQLPKFFQLMKVFNNWEGENSHETFLSIYPTVQYVMIWREALPKPMSPNFPLGIFRCMGGGRTMGFLTWVIALLLAFLPLFPLLLTATGVAWWLVPLPPPPMVGPWVSLYISETRDALRKSLRWSTPNMLIKVLSITRQTQVRAVIAAA